jgi:outer membrane protein TolC
MVLMKRRKNKHLFLFNLTLSKQQRVISCILSMLLLLWQNAMVWAQEAPPTMSLSEFYALVFQYHPVVKNANTLSDIAKAEIRMARGMFDPKLEATFATKKLSDKLYYNNLNPELKIPLWPGPMIKAGNERNIGNFVNPEYQTTDKGLTYAGLMVPLGQGLFIDERRNALNQALLFQNIAEAEQVKLINKILLEAAKAYWDWYFTFGQLKYSKVARQLAEVRYKAVKERSEAGDLAPIDSVEALIFFQDRDIALQLASVEFRNASLYLSTFLWDAEGKPANLNPAVTPVLNLEQQIIITDDKLEELKDAALQNHPELVKINNKMRQVEYDVRLAKEYLKPLLNVNYNLLSNNYVNFSEANLLQNNYKAGIDFSFPLLLRKERGKFLSIKTKALQLQFEKSDLQRQIENDILMAYNEMKTLEGLLIQQEKMVNNYNILRNGELKKFENGESSLFLVNSRELKLVEAQIKLQSLRAKYQKERAMLYWAAGKSEYEYVR